MRYFLAFTVTQVSVEKVLHRAEPFAFSVTSMLVLVFKL